MPTSRSARHLRHLPLLLGNRLTARTANVSASGFSVEAPFVFMPGARLDGTFEVDGRELPFRGEVVWAHAASQTEAPCRMGVRFTHVAAEARGLLEG